MKSSQINLLNWQILYMALNRSLHPLDYELLGPFISSLEKFEKTLNGIPYRKDHEHRNWEYGNVLFQLSYLDIPLDAKILDIGSGASYFPLYLKKVLGSENVHVNDSMAYGDCTPILIEQCQKLDILLPLFVCPVEDMSSIPDNSYDVTLCISVIEHVARDKFVKALQEMVRITRPGGYIFMTSDLFETEARAEQSPFRQIQHNIFTPEKASILDELVPVRFVGGEDFAYRGDFVNNYSFVNFCLEVVK